MNRAMFNIWMDETYERQGLFGMTAFESDVEYEFLTMDEEEPVEWLVNREDEGTLAPCCFVERLSAHNHS